ncbi:hypothetical protein ACTFIZ_000416 [Dictyostelium cf. discoideum]
MKPLVYGNSGEKEESNEKGNYHTSVVTDVYGQSTSKTISGVETHLLFYFGMSIQIPDGASYVDALFYKRHKDNYHTVMIQKWSANNNYQLTLNTLLIDYI